MKPIPKPLYPCKHCYEDHSWHAVDLFWSEIDQDWVCDECWDDRFSENEPKGICLADEIKEPTKQDQDLLTIAYMYGVKDGSKRVKELENALQDIADEQIFNVYDCADCTEEVYETGKALVQTARDVLKEGE